MRVVAVALLAISAGCRSAGRGLLDDDVTYKAPAIKQAVARENEKAVPKLIEDLDDDDAAVRFYAIEGLRRLTGQDLGYRYYDHAPARRPSVERWQAWAKATRP